MGSARHDVDEGVISSGPINEAADWTKALHGRYVVLPVLIVGLARDIIRFSGFSEDENQIIFAGLQLAEWLLKNYGLIEKRLCQSNARNLGWRAISWCQVKFG